MRLLHERQPHSAESPPSFHTLLTTSPLPTGSTTAPAARFRFPALPPRTPCAYRCSLATLPPLYTNCLPTPQLAGLWRPHKARTASCSTVFTSDPTLRLRLSTVLPRHLLLESLPLLVFLTRTRVSRPRCSAVSSSGADRASERTERIRKLCKSVDKPRDRARCPLARPPRGRRVIFASPFPESFFTPVSSSALLPKARWTLACQLSSSLRTTVTTWSVGGLPDQSSLSSTRWRPIVDET